MAKASENSDLQVRRKFAERLQAARVMAGYKSRKELAEKLGVESETYRRWERAETEPNIPLLLRISALLNVSLDFLIAGNPPVTEVPKTVRRA